MFKNEASPLMEGRSFLGRFGFVLASFIPALGRAGILRREIKWLVDLKGKGRSVGQEWVKCKKCGKRFLRPTKDEPLISVVN